MELMEAVYGEDYARLKPDDFDDDGKLVEFITAAEKLRDPAINPNIMFPGEGMEVVKGFRFMGQRFIPDSYMFQQLVFNKVAGRFFPKGLDVLAVLSNSRAYDILVKRYGEDRYAEYVEQLKKLKKEFESLADVAWAQNLYWNWLYVLMALLNPKGGGYPYFMQNPAWADKELATALGSWAELRHDTILYAKQSYGITGMPPRTKYLKGYVEPNAELYARLAALAKFTQNGLKSRGLLLPVFSRKFSALEGLLLSLKEISEAELQNQLLTEEQYYTILGIGDTLEDITTFPTEISREIEGEGDTEMAVIADVHTDPNSGRVLEEGVGYPMNIYAVVPVEGDLQIVQGGMFSYYEFTQPMNDRLTDEKWQVMLETNPSDLPIWFDSFVDIPQSKKMVEHRTFDSISDPWAVQPFGKGFITWGKIKRTALYQNYPNPFNPETWIPYQLGSASPVTIHIYNSVGQLILRLHLGLKKPGLYLTKDKAAYWDGRDSFGEKVASGVYFYRLQAGNFSAVRKMVILK